MSGDANNASALEQELGQLRDSAGEAYANVSDKNTALESANGKVDSAQEAYDKAQSDYYNGLAPGEEGWEAMQKAKEELDKAQEEAEAAEAELEAAAQEAQEAKDALDANKEARDAARPTDMRYVINMAETSCECGLRDSVLSMLNTNGVYIHGLPQMIVSDNIPVSNIINFGGCRSHENPSVIAAAEEVVKKAREEWENRDKTFGEKVGEFFCGKKEQDFDITEELLDQCVGDCTPIIAMEWDKGMENVEIGGKKPLLRRCELRCIYGGEIILETSGQPE